VPFAIGEIFSDGSRCRYQSYRFAHQKLATTQEAGRCPSFSKATSFWVPENRPKTIRYVSCLRQTLCDAADPAVLIVPNYYPNCGRILRRGHLMTPRKTNFV